MDGGQNVSAGIEIKVISAVVILFLVLSAAVIYLHRVAPAGPAQGSAPLSDADKLKLLNQLSQRSASTTSAQSKLQLLAKLQKQVASSTLSDSDKLKLLESLK